MFEGLKTELKKYEKEYEDKAVLDDPIKFKKECPKRYAAWVEQTPNAEELITKAIQDKAERDAAAIEYNKTLHGKNYQTVSSCLLSHYAGDDLDCIYRTFAPELSAAIERAGKMPDYIDKIEYKGLYNELSRQYDALSKHYETLQKRYNTLCQKLGKYEDVPYELEEVEYKEEKKTEEKPQERGGGR